LSAKSSPASETAGVPESAARVGQTRIIPAFWMPVDPILAWLAFGSAETDLDTAYYFGASIWHAANPDHIVEWLAEIKETGEFAYDPAYPELLELEGGVMSRAARTASYQTALAEAKKKNAEEKAKAEAAGDPKIAARISLPGVKTVYVREAASELLEELETDLPEATSKQSALWNASETLRRAIAKGDIKAFGWRGHGPDFSDQHKPIPLRERIPDDLFAAPITITGRGLLSFALGDGGFGTPEVPRSGVLCDSFDVLKIKPIPDDDSVKVEYSLPRQEKQKPPLNGLGRPPREDWKQFHQELIRYLVVEEAAPSRTKTRRYMKEWADANMGETPPSDKSIEREIDKLVIEAVYAE